jgi:Holliday junction resolvase
VKTPESYEKQAIKKYLDSIGCWYFSPYMAGFGKSGVPDIVACLDGKFIAIEVKREGKVPTVIQNRTMEEITSSGGVAIWGIADKVIEELKLCKCQDDKEPLFWCPK